MSDEHEVTDEEVQGLRRALCCALPVCELFSALGIAPRDAAMFLLLMAEFVTQVAATPSDGKTQRQIFERLVAVSLDWSEMVQARNGKHPLCDVIRGEQSVEVHVIDVTEQVASLAEMIAAVEKTNAPGGQS